MTTGAKEVESFLTMPAVERKVSASTHNQALSALLFLYREVHDIDLPWSTEIKRPTWALDALMGAAALA